MAGAHAVLAEQHSLEQRAARRAQPGVMRRAAEFFPAFALAELPCGDGRAYAGHKHGMPAATVVPGAAVIIARWNCCCSAARARRRATSRTTCRKSARSAAASGARR